MFIRILVPLDGSTLAEKALPYATTLAQRLNSELIIATVVADQPGSAVYHTRHGSKLNTIAEANTYLQTMYDLVTNWPAPLGLPAAQIVTRVCTGDPLTELVQLTKELQIDLIVTSTHSRTGVARLLEDSVAIGLVEQTELPVLVVHPLPNEELEPLANLANQPESTTARFMRNPFLRLVVTLDGSPEAEAALGPATQLAEDLTAPVCLLRIAESHQAPQGFILDADFSPDGRGRLETHTNLPIDIYRYLARIQDSLLDHELDCVDVVRDGNVVTEIVNYGTQLTAPVLIVMATHSSHHTHNAQNYSIAEEVVRRSHLPILLLNIPSPVATAAP